MKLKAFTLVVNENLPRDTAVFEVDGKEVGRVIGIGGALAGPALYVQEFGRRLYRPPTPAQLRALTRATKRPSGHILPLGPKVSGDAVAQVVDCLLRRGWAERDVVKVDGVAIVPYYRLGTPKITQAGRDVVAAAKKETNL